MHGAASSLRGKFNTKKRMPCRQGDHLRDFRVPEAPMMRDRLGQPRRGRMMRGCLDQCCQDGHFRSFCVGGTTPRQGSFHCGKAPNRKQRTQRTHRQGSFQRGKAPNNIRARLREIAKDNWRMWEFSGRMHPETICDNTFDRVYSRRPGERRAEVCFSEDDTVTAILTANTIFKGKRVVALNFANGVRPGGGYKTGATAQEEDLCRAIPDLYASLCGAERRGLYPFGPSAVHGRPLSEEQQRCYSTVLRTSDLIVKRRSDFQLLPRHEHQPVSLVHAAAPNINFSKDTIDEELLKITIRSILVPWNEDPNSVLILGAWGCGAFGGDPEFMSRLFVECIDEISMSDVGPCFSHIWFAIPPGRNHQAFRRAFHEFKPTLLDAHVG